MTHEEEEEEESGGELAPSTLLERARAELRVKDAELEQKYADLEAAAKSGLTLVKENRELKSCVERLSENLRRTQRQVPHPRLAQSVSNLDAPKVGSDADVSDFTEASDGAPDDSAGTEKGESPTVGSPDDTPSCSSAASADRCAPLEVFHRPPCFTSPSRALSVRRTWMSPARFADLDFIHTLEVEHTELKWQLETVVGESERAQRVARHTQKRLETKLEKARADLDAALREKDELERVNRLLARQRVDIAGNQHSVPRASATATLDFARSEPSGGAFRNNPQSLDYAWRENEALRRLLERVAELELSAQSLKSAKSDAEQRLRAVLVDLEVARRRVEELVVLEAEVLALRSACEKQQDDIRELCEELKEERARNVDMARADASPAIPFASAEPIDLGEPATPQPSRQANFRPHRGRDGDGVSAITGIPAVHSYALDNGQATPTARRRRPTCRTLQAEFEMVLKGETQQIAQIMDHEGVKESSARDFGETSMFLGLANSVAGVYRSEYGDRSASTQFSVCRKSGPFGFVYGCFYGVIRYAKFLVILFLSVVYALWAGPKNAGL